MLDMSAATEIIISTLKGFKEPASEAGRLVDILNTVSNQYATSVTELGTGMSKLSPIAAKMGFSFEETAGILTPVIEIFRSGDEASNALRTGLLKLIDDAAPVQAGLEALGVSQRDANGALRSGRDILFDVATAFQTADANEKLFLASSLVGIRQAAKMVEVFDGLAYSTEITGVAMGATGSRVAETAARLVTAQVSIDRFVVGLENIGIAVGDQFRQAAKEAIDGATTIETTLSNLISTGALDPVLDEVVDFSAKLRDYLNEVAKVMPEAFADLDWDPLTDSFDDLGETIQNLFTAFFGDVDLTTAEGLTSALQKLIESFATLTQTVSGILVGWTPFVELLGNLVDEVLDAEDSSKKFTGTLLGWAGVLDSIFSRIGFLTAALNLLIGAKAVTSVIAMVGSINSLGAAAVTVTSTLGLLGVAVAAFAGGYALAEWAYQSDTAFTKLVDNFNQTILGFSGLDEASIKNAEYMASETRTAGDLAVALVRLSEDAELVPDEVGSTVYLRGTEEYNDELARILQSVQEIPFEKITDVKTVVDEASVVNAKDFIFQELDGVITIIQPTINSDSLNKVQDDLAKLPLEKRLELTLETDAKIKIAEIQAAAETVQSAFEWKAKIDIAEIESNAQIMEALADSIGATFTSTGDVISSLFGQIGDLSGSELWALQSQISKENERRDAALQLEQELTTAQIAYLAAKTEAMEKGDALIKISMEGVYPELELIMWEVIRRVQVQANAEGSELLLGI